MEKNETLIMLLHTMTPTHAGSGTELSYVDLPIQREAHTGIPTIEASTLKGCCRAAISEKNKENENRVNQIFGSPEDGEIASAISFTDARLLFFPVRSVIGVFAFITCPFVLQRFFDDYEIVMGSRLEQKMEFNSETQLLESSIPERKPEKMGIVRCKSLEKTKYSQKETNSGNSISASYQIMLEDYTFTVEEDKRLNELLKLILKNLPKSSITQEMFESNTVVLSDDDFIHFVKHSTEIATRIKINQETGTVEGTALFTEEFLPPDCLLYNLLFFSQAHSSQKTKETVKEERMSASKIKESFLDLFKDNIFQIGADRTLGKGLVKRSFWGIKECQNESEEQ